MKKQFFITDAHCHVFPEAIAEKATLGTDRFYGLHSHYIGSTGVLLNDVAPDGVDHFVIQSVATAAKQVSSINHFIAEEVKLHPDLFTGLGTMHPESNQLESDMDELCALGLRGVKLHPDIQGFRADEDYSAIYDLCQSRGLPVLLHTGDYRYDYSNPDRIAHILKRFPKLILVGAHLGGWSVWDEACLKLADFENFYVDSSSSFYSMIDALGHARSIILRYGVDRVMFATDFPMWAAKDELRYLFDLGFSDEELRKILSRNAAKIYSSPIA